jgi:hypothetical protein
MAEYGIVYILEISCYELETNLVALFNRCYDLVASRYLLHLWCPWGICAMVSPTL